MSKDTDFHYGIHAVQAILTENARRIRTVSVLKGRSDQRIQRILDLARDHQVKFQIVEKKAFERLISKAGGQDVRHQGVIAECNQMSSKSEADLEQILDNLDRPPLLLILDGITDPHNLGACLRTADAAGVHALIAPKDKSANLNATAVKTACGAAETVPFVQVTNLARTMKYLQQRGVWIIGTAGEASSNVYQSKLNGSLALVMGAEGKGMRRLTRENCDELIHIPMAGSVSSLNVSVATGVCLFEIVRQQQTSDT